jgi:hypothetical protein
VLYQSRHRQIKRLNTTDPLPNVPRQETWEVLDRSIGHARRRRHLARPTTDVLCGPAATVAAAADPATRQAGGPTASGLDIGMPVGVCMPLPFAIGG